MKIATLLVTVSAALVTYLSCSGYVTVLSEGELGRIHGGDVFCYNDVRLRDCPDYDGTLFLQESDCDELFCVADGEGGHRCPKTNEGLDFGKMTSDGEEYSDTCLSDYVGLGLCTHDDDWYCYHIDWCAGDCGLPDANGNRKCSTKQNKAFTKKDYYYPDGPSCPPGA